MIPALESRFKKLEEYRSWFAGLADRGIDTAAPLAKNEWSASEVVEHLVLAEQFMVHALEHPQSSETRPPAFHAVRKRLVRFILEHGIKVPVPSPRVIPSGGKPLAESLASWANLRKKLETLLAVISPDNLGRRGFEHPRAGSLDVAESLDFTGYHLAYHKRRVETLLRKR